MNDDRIYDLLVEIRSDVHVLKSRMDETSKRWGTVEKHEQRLQKLELLTERQEVMLEKLGEVEDVKKSISELQIATQKYGLWFKAIGLALLPVYTAVVKVLVDLFK